MESPSATDQPFVRCAGDSSCALALPSLREDKLPLASNQENSVRRAVEHFRKALRMNRVVPKDEFDPIARGELDAPIPVFNQPEILRVRGKPYARVGAT
jgi:hypothetical protein